MERLIRTLIVDDEQYSRDELKYLLGSYSNIQIVGEAESGEEAIVKAIELQPDVVFLDVEMPRMNGMQVAKVLSELKSVPLIVFATAYTDFAAEAFRYEAVNYVLKPFEEEQMKETVQRLETKLGANMDADIEKPTGKLAVDVEGEIFYIEPSDILYIVRDDKVTKLITKDNQFETKMPLKDLEGRLVSYGFFRIHKSFLVNLEHVARLTPWFNGAYQLQINGREELLSVSRNYVKGLRAKLEI